MAKKAIKCSQMFDSQTGCVKENVVILIDGDKIIDVVSAGSVGSLEDYQVIDLTGKFVTPGLIDCHMHLGSNGEGSSMGTRPYTTIGTSTLKALKNVGRI